MSYTIDIYRSEIKPTRKFFDFALFVAFFPQLVAGPIERAKNLLPQILKPRQIYTEGFYTGCRLILWGLFKKIVVADRLGMYVDVIYGNAPFHSSMTFLVATFFFAFQIYCDFSGYSTIARGVAKLLGFDIMVNFKNPYFAGNVREFWRRWHISLSSWLRDYLYIPLGGNRKGEIKTYRNIFITMLLGGLWHGANWTFLLWGALHGMFIILSKIASRAIKARPIKRVSTAFSFKIVSTAVTFFLVVLTWVFFRAANITEALYILKSIFVHPLHFFVGSRSYLIYGVMGIAFVAFMEQKGRLKPNGDVLRFSSTIAQWGVCYLVVFLIILFGVVKGEQFIYFQF